MNWLNKLERKIGRYAIPNLVIWLIGAYAIGFVLHLVSPSILNYLNFQPYYICHGQIWRIITWIFQPTDTNIIFLLIMMLFYYQLGTVLERTWGTFRFNVYIIGGILVTALGCLLIYGISYLIFGSTVAHLVSQLMGAYVSTTYINMSIFLAFAAMYPDMQVMLYFIIPIKMKWMALVYVLMLGYNVISTFRAYYAYYGAGMAWLVAGVLVVIILLSLLNFLIFFLSTRNLQRFTPHEVHRRQQFKAQMREPRPGSGITKHKCAVCGRTEKDDPTLEFRFCSKCEGNYEYCQDHLFTHQHIRRN
jgi:hypothetical protein